jgi:fibronectin type 3 domain-containing protein
MLTSLTLNEGFKTIGPNAFYGNNRITGLVLPNTLISIGENAFRDCTGLSGSLAVPGSVTVIGNNAFYNCTGLNGTLTLQNGITSIGAYAFQNCSKLTGDLIIPDSVTNIGTYAFYNCYGFNGRLKLSENLTVINHETFFYCSNFIGGIIIPDKVTSIGNRVFCPLTGITSIVFGEGLRQIGSSGGGYESFNGCSGVTEIVFKGPVVPTLAGTTQLTTMSNLKTIYVPLEAYAAYVAAYSPFIPAGAEFSTDTLKMPVRNLVAEKIYSKSVALSWSRHVNDNVIKYAIKRDGAIVGETTDCFYHDDGLTTGQTYAYTVYGLTAGNAESGAAFVSAIPLAPAINSIKTDNVLNKIGLTNNAIYIETPNTKNHLPLGDLSTTGMLYYISPETTERVLIGPAAVRNVTATIVVYAVNWQVTGVADGIYDVVFVLTDIDGASAEKYAQIIVDHSVPAKISGVAAVGDLLGITVSWSIAAETDTTKYRVYRRSEIDSSFYVTTTINGRNTLSYRDNNVVIDRLYHYYVVGVNDFGQESPASDIATAFRGVDAEPPVVTGMSPLNNTVISGNTTITATATDNMAVVKVELYYSTDSGENWTLFSAKTAAPYNGVLNTGALADGIIRVKAVAYDAAGNISLPLEYSYVLLTEDSLPQVTNISPAHGSMIGGTCNISVAATHPVQLREIELQTSADNGATWQVYATVATPTVMAYTATFAFDTSKFANGAVYIRAFAYSPSGAKSNDDCLLCFTYLTACFALRT